MTASRFGGWQLSPSFSLADIGGRTHSIPMEFLEGRNRLKDPSSPTSVFLDGETEAQRVERLVQHSPTGPGQDGERRADPDGILFAVALARCRVWAAACDSAF